MKKTICALLAALLLISIIPVFSNAIIQDEVEYETNGDVLTLVAYKGSGGDLRIPSSIGGVNVTKIEKGAFRETDIRSVYIPSTVKEIGSDCFKNCQKLSYVVVPESVTVIGVNAFDVAEGNRKFVIRCYSGSEIEKYAKTNDIETTYLLKIPEVTATAVSQNEIHLEWNKIPEATSYYIYNIVNEKRYKIGETKSTSYDVTGLVGNTEYKYYVRSVGDISNDESSEYNEIYAVTCKTFLNYPDVRAVYGTNSITLSWRKVDGAYSYKIYLVNEKDLELLEETEDIQFVYNDLDTNKDYKFFVGSVDSEGKVSKYDKERVVSASTITAAPKFTAVASWESIDVEWEPVEGAAYYTIFIASNDSDGYTVVENVYDPNQTTYTIGGKLSALTTYRVLVRAFNEFGDGSSYNESMAVKCRIKGFYIYASVVGIVILAAVIFIIIRLVRRHLDQYEVDCTKDRMDSPVTEDVYLADAFRAKFKKKKKQ